MKRPRRLQHLLRKKQMKSIALTHFSAHVADDFVDESGAGADTLLCTGGELYCVALVEKSTV